jgi:hypothetical protein
MGVKQRIHLFDIVDNVVNDSPNKLSIFSIIIGCTTSALDGSSPRGYSRKFSNIGSKILPSFLFSFFYLLLFHRVRDQRS